MSGRYPEWASDGADWPNHECSRFVAADGYNWHVQQMGEATAPVCILLHGTGAATHSWRGVMPLLAAQYSVIAVDLPGHGFTRPNNNRKVTLDGMAGSIAALLSALNITPALIVGHSAGAAISAQMILDQSWRVPLIGFTPALMPFPGMAARLFPQLAKMLFTNPFISIIFSRMARSPGEAVKFLKRATGSHIDAAGALYYTRLFSTSGHCDGAIRMMANWRLEPLRDRLIDLKSPVLLVYATYDAAIKKEAVLDAAARISGCEVHEMAGLGHLAHEEDPAGAAQIIADFMAPKQVST
jgi:magnesium chelatase accessory protein